jgi:hypothetical protein
MLVTFLGHFSGAIRKKKRHDYFMQVGATAHTATYSINVLNEVFEGLWPARSPDLNPCDFYLCGNLKDKVYSNNPHTLV